MLLIQAELVAVIYSDKSVVLQLENPPPIIIFLCPVKLVSVWLVLT